MGDVDGKGGISRPSQITLTPSATPLPRWYNKLQLALGHLHNTMVDTNYAI